MNRPNVLKSLLYISMAITTATILSSCVSTKPVPVEQPESVEKSYTTTQARNVEGVEILKQDTELKKILQVSDVALVNGEHRPQFRARLSNTGSRELQITTDPVWFNSQGIQLTSRYNQQKTHILRKGQSISLTHNAVSKRARTVRLVIACPNERCK